MVSTLRTARAKAPYLPYGTGISGAGADGVLIEVHPKPETALSDGDQSLLPVEYKKLVDDARKVAKGDWKDAIKLRTEGQMHGGTEG